MRQIKPQFRIISIAILGLCMSSCGGNEEAPTLVTGTAWAACSPVDGVATRFEFPVENQQKLIFGLNRSVDSLVGQWNIGNGDTENGLSVFLCPIDSYNSCTQIRQGVFRIESRVDKTVSGSWQLIDTITPHKNSNFKASLTSVAQPMCG
ncbi:hypothetical protein [Undibacterium flavidum]|uniref:Lipoprotein n=1 Tax=Undibacterium flavidum TaxID=2762297 RepID=A0ABR6YF47_9BURK|nr:hypothetical protein [Undibacterium flavidum]MBC3875173.1 hypothetical protein [Undibacterium flavidum]